ncbi:hypothetical protein PV10_08342 [Exophiala mesophila]|uniref:Uncharacterized protein n=1 Tax=Exophiala mesophila TaxID=212818 RepID=A0A0D1Z1N5_EXOME|nr:uncharacterized protein PV10_08342 [Exophiala mesophila]KIV88682.1 hypothetical protein PV10_08342 [Exophiala mesophila]
MARHKLVQVFYSHQQNLNDGSPSQAVSLLQTHHSRDPKVSNSMPLDMAHKRNTSRGSFSFFSLDTIRSLSRAGTRQGMSQLHQNGQELTEIPTAARVPSEASLVPRPTSVLSFQCDPNSQPPPSPTPNRNLYSSNESLTQIEPVQTPIPVPKPKTIIATGTPRPRDNDPDAEGEVDGDRSRRPRTHRLRPLSWFSLSGSSSRAQYPRSLSVHLTKTASSSTVARSVISAPILTSTTNQAVAQRENVPHSELSEASFTQTPWNPQTGKTAQAIPDRLTDSISASATNSSATPSGPRTTSRRRRILRLGDAFRVKLRGSPLVDSGEKVPSTSQDNGYGKLIPTDGLSVTSPTHPLEHNFDLYRAKMKKLTSRGCARRKPSGNDYPPTTKDPPLLAELTQDSNLDHYENDSAFGSLTRSFASAVDKLDFQASLPRSVSNMSFLKSKSSYFSLKKGVGQDEKHGAIVESQPDMSATIESTILPERKNAPKAKMKDGSATALTTVEVLAARQNVPRPQIFSVDHNAYISSDPIQHYPRGVNPLRMHPPESGQPAASPLPQRADTPSQLSEDGADSITLEDAPIYSPSLGDLSQYSRDTPRSHKKPASLTKKRREVTGGDTPTRQVHARSKPPSRGELKKSGSGFGLFNKAKEAKQMHGRIDQSAASSGSFKGRATPLKERDANQSMASQDGQGIRKSRSLVFGGLLKTKTEPASRSSTPVPFQPATPSPLRNVTRIRRSQSRSTVQDVPTRPRSRKLSKGRAVSELVELSK